MASKINKAKNKAKVAVKKKVSTPSKKTKVKQKAKAVVAPKGSLGTKKASTPVKHKTKAKTVKKTITPVKQKAKVGMAKKAKAPAKQKAKTVVAKKVTAPVKQKVKVAAAKKAINLTKDKKKNTKLKAKTPEAKAKIDIKHSAVPTNPIHGEDLHFIPEHDGITHPVTPLEAHKKENIFHSKEEVTFHQENKKRIDAMPSQKSRKVYNRNRGF